MDETSGAAPTQMDLGSEHIQQLAELSERMNFLLRSAEDVARELTKACRVANDTFKRIEAAQTPRQIVTLAQVRAENRPTVLAVGPQTVLRVLAECFPPSVTRSDLAAACKYKESTLRTYLPVLAESGLIMGTELIEITEAGLHAIEPKIPRKFIVAGKLVTQNAA